MSVGGQTIASCPKCGVACADTTLRHECTVCNVCGLDREWHGKNRDVGILCDTFTTESKTKNIHEPIKITPEDQERLIEYAELGKAKAATFQANVALNTELEALQVKLARYEAALTHYADKSHWHVLPIMKNVGADNQIRRFFNNGDAVDGWTIAQRILAGEIE
jgi:hypothetical protein